MASDDNQANFTLCGPTLPFPVYSTGNFMSLTLVSASNNVPGFNASYETITDEMCKCLKILMIRIILMVLFDNQANFALCGPTLPFPVYSTGNFMSLRLVSATNNVPGFNASYETITDEMCKCPKILKIRIMIMILFTIIIIL